MNTKIIITSIGVFGMFFVVFNFMMGIIWEASFHEKVYNCTDSLPFGYLSPGDWVHGDLEYVAVIRDDVPMSDPDTILEGWSLTRLWRIWLLMFGGAVFASFICTWGMLKMSRKNLVEQDASSDR